MNELIIYIPNVNNYEVVLRTIIIRIYKKITSKVSQRKWPKIHFVLNW